MMMQKPAGVQNPFRPLSQMKTVTIVGATSPTGLGVVPAFAAEGWRVLASYRDRAAVPAEWLPEQSVEPTLLDLLSGEVGRAAGAESIVWLAHIDAGRFNEAEVEINREALLRFLGRVDARRTRSFVFVSSGGSVYGHPRSLPIDEDHPREPLSSYGQAKRALEDEVLRFGERSGVRVAVLRPGNIFGFERPDRKCKGVTAAFLNAVDRGLPFTLIHGGRTVRDFVHIDDVCRAIMLAAESDAPAAVWNVGSGIGTSTIDWIEMLRSESGVEMPPLVERENYTSDVLENVLSHRRITEATGWAPSVSVSEGARLTVAHWRAFRDAAVFA